MRPMVSTFASTPMGCFEAGASARAAGKPLSANPFPPRCDHHEEWSEGWKAIFDLDEDADPCSLRLSAEDDIAACKA